MDYYNKYEKNKTWWYDLEEAIKQYDVFLLRKDMYMYICTWNLQKVVKDLKEDEAILEYEFKLIGNNTHGKPVILDGWYNPKRLLGLSQKLFDLVYCWHSWGVDWKN